MLCLPQFSSNQTSIIVKPIKELNWEIKKDNREWSQYKNGKKRE